jgi:hypothetical protein
MSVNNLRLDNLPCFDLVSALTKIPSLRLADIDQHLPSQINFNKTLCGALTRWGYTSHTNTQLLSGKVEYKRKRFNTVLKCGRPYK